MMVTGNAARMPALSLDSLFKPARTMTATIAAEMGGGSSGEHSLPMPCSALASFSFGSRSYQLVAAATIFKKQRRGGLR